MQYQRNQVHFRCNNKEDNYSFVENIITESFNDSNYEKECLRKFIVCHQAITILETIREKELENNDSDENEIFLQKGKQGLRIVLGNNSISELIK